MAEFNKRFEGCWIRDMRSLIITAAIWSLDNTTGRGIE